MKIEGKNNGIDTDAIERELRGETHESLKENQKEGGGKGHFKQV